MMSLLYNCLILPLETALHWVLATAYDATGSPGMAILMLSLTFNLLLLPVYHLAEKVQDRERAAQERLAPKLEEFRTVFKGQVRYMMIRTLYRQHHYHPIFALRALLPLLIQVPFFLATFHLIANFQPLYGQSFLFFADLGKPDGLLGGVNLMPFAMTAANLASGFIYTKHLANQDKVQIWAIAFLFLVLLYNRPVALVMYWTCSNVFSLAKNMVYARLRMAAATQLEFVK